MRQVIRKRVPVCAIGEERDRLRALLERARCDSDHVRKYCDCGDCCRGMSEGQNDPDDPWYCDCAAGHAAQTLAAIDAELSAPAGQAEIADE